MRALGIILSVALIAVTLWDAFEVILQPRRVMRPYRFTRLFYRSTWSVWRRVARMVPAGRRRESFLAAFGPLSVLALFAAWVVVLVFAFGVLHFELASPLLGPDDRSGFPTYLYLSGTTFFTLGLGDITPSAPLGRALTVCESGIGFGFLAAIIAYLPVLFQAFSRREGIIALLDAQAGSPPTASEFLLRMARGRKLTGIDAPLAEWERWCAELLESHLSFPVLSYYRSQHDNQSWLAALTMMLDTCAVLIVEVKRPDTYQVELTFGMARHAAVDLALVLGTSPELPDHDRLPPEHLRQIRERLQAAGIELRDPEACASKLNELRGMYEPFVRALAMRFMFALPDFLPDKDRPDNWQTSAWMRRTPGIGSLPPAAPGDEHFS